MEFRRVVPARFALPVLRPRDGGAGRRLGRVVAARFALPALLLVWGCGTGPGEQPPPARSTAAPAAFTEDAADAARGFTQPRGPAAFTEDAGDAARGFVPPAGPAAFTEDVIDAARRFAQPSNDLRLAVLEEELRRRELPHARQTFPGGGADEDRDRGHNVVVALGAGPPRIVVGGHFDAVRLDDGVLGQGMVDNGAGVLVLLRVAETLRDAALRGTVHVVFFDMEEVGLLGSRAYVEALDPAPGAVMVNVDVVGYGDTLLYGPGRLAAEDPLAGHVHRVCARHAAACVGTPRMPPSDDRSFRGAGIPAVSLAMLPADEAHRLWLILNGGLSDTLRGALAPPILRTIHTDRDTADKLEPAALTRAARIVTDLVLALDAAAP